MLSLTTLHMVAENGPVFFNFRDITDSSIEHEASNQHEGTHSVTLTSHDSN